MFQCLPSSLLINLHICSFIFAVCGRLWGQLQPPCLKVQYLSLNFFFLPSLLLSLPPHFPPSPFDSFIPSLESYTLLFVLNS